jgi:ubiquinone/menaquinone biosynthesis C-methylase UbiE
MTTRSETATLRFYEVLGPRGLAGRTSPKQDRAVLSELRKLLPQPRRVLDLGCGYGRIAIPLAAAGHSVVGLDLCPGLLREARANADRSGLSIAWVRATMRRLPLADSSLEVVLCLWTAFFELIDREEQISTLKEVLRVLAPGGWAMFEGPVYSQPSPSQIGSGERSGPNNRIFAARAGDAKNLMYCHDEGTLREVSKLARVENPDVSIRPWGIRDRLFLRFSKPACVERA